MFISANNIWHIFSATILVAILTAIITGWLRHYALSKGLMDVPNERSSHDTPTPRGGGLAIVTVFTGLSIILQPLTQIPWTMLNAVLGGGILVAGVGFMDDLGHVRARWRLLTHLLAGAAFMLFIGGFEKVAVGIWTMDMGWFGYVAGTLFIVWMINLYNFMDGIDGIAGIELVTAGGGAVLLLLWLGELDKALWLSVLVGCGLGFLIWNWPPAKIFMGDVGSGFLGFVLSAFVLWTGINSGITIWAWLILLGVFIVDATWTLVQRIMMGQPFYHAHRTHAYQYAVRRFKSHGRVSVLTGLINVLWLLPLAALASLRPELGLVLLFVAWTPLMFLCRRLGAGVPEEGEEGR